MAPSAQTPEPEPQSSEEQALSPEVPEQEASSEQAPEDQEAAPSPDGEEPPEAEEPKPKDGEQEKPGGHKRQTGYQRRIERLERQNQMLLEQLQRGGPAVNVVAQKEKTPEEKAAEQFERFVDTRVEQREAQRAERETVAKFHERTNAFRAAHPDFDEALADVAHIPVPAALQQALLTSEQGPEIMYALATNPAELARISALPPFVAAREIGRLEARASGATPQKTTTTPAKRPPAPPSSVGGTAAKSTRSLETLPISEYKKAIRSGRR